MVAGMPVELDNFWNKRQEGVFSVFPDARFTSWVNYFGRHGFILGLGKYSKSGYLPAE